MLFSLLPYLIAVLLTVAACSSGGALHQDLDDYRSTIRHLERQLVRDNGDIEALRELGILYVRVQHYTRGRALLSEVLSQDSHSPRTHFYLGLALEALVDSVAADDAVTLGQRALDHYAIYSDAEEPYRRLMRGRYLALSRDLARREVRELLALERQREASFGAASEALSSTTVGVFPLRYRGGDARFAPLGRGLSEMMTVDLAGVSSLTVVERVRLQALLDEVALAETDAFDPDTAPRRGLLLGAGTIVGGSYAVLSGNNLQLDVAFYDVVSGRNPPPTSAANDVSALFRLQNEVVLRLLDDMGVTLTPAEREGILSIPTRSLEAFLAYSLGLLQDDEGDFAQAVASFDRAVRLDPDFKLAQEKLDEAESRKAAGTFTATMAQAQRYEARQVGRVESMPASKSSAARSAQASFLVRTIVAAPKSSPCQPRRRFLRTTDAMRRWVPRFTGSAAGLVSSLLFITVVLLSTARPVLGQQNGVDGFRFPLELAPRTYKMVSSPFELERSRLRDIFEDDYGPYVPTTWRLFRYDTLRETFAEYSEIRDESLEPGDAVWLITRDGAAFDLFEEGDAVTVPTETVILEAFTGWNQVANPFDFPIPCRDLLDRARSEPQVVRIEGPVFFDGTDYQYNVNVCQPYEGYYIYLETPLPLFPVPVPPTPAGTHASEVASTLPVTLDTEHDYLLQLSAAVPGTPLQDTQNYVGFKHTAAPGLDAHDFREAPTMEDGIQVSIVEDGRRLAGSFKPVPDTGQRWTLTFRSPRPHTPVEVTLHEYGQLPDGFERFLLDEGTLVSLSGPSFRVAAGDGRDRRLTLILGTEGFARAQASAEGADAIPVTLQQNVPNPFSHTTTMRYRLEQPSRVVLDIYDLHGRRLRRLVDALQPAGPYAVPWDGRDATGRPAASGLYLYRLQTGARADTRSMLLMR